MFPVIRLVRDGNTFALRLTSLCRYMTASCLVLAIGMVTWWYVFSWGDHIHDTQMKWIVFASGLIFLWLSGSYALTARRYRASGQQFLADMRCREVRIESPSHRITIPLCDIIGLQILDSIRGAQLNLVYNAGSALARAWIHTDAHRAAVARYLTMVDQLPPPGDP